MKIDDIKQITASDLRVIVLALKLEEFNIDDERAKNDVYDRIKRLPSPETINLMASNKEAIHGLQTAIGHILEMVDKFSARDEDYKVRYKARTSLDPRYKVLEYKRIIAKKEIKMKKEAGGLVRELVRVSSDLDKSGHGKLSGDLIAIAKSVKDETANEDTIQKFNGAVESLNLAGFASEAEALLKQAGFWSGVGNVAKGIGQGVQQGVQNAVDTVKGVGQGIKEQYQLGNLAGTFDKVNKELATAVDYATKAYSSIQDAGKRQQASEILTMLQNMQTMGTQVYRISMEDSEAAAPATETTSLGAAPAGASSPVGAAFDASPETSSFSAGQNITWETGGGKAASGTVIGPNPNNPNTTMVQLPNGRSYQVSTEKLRAACERYRLRRQG